MPRLRSVSNAFALLFVLAAGFFIVRTLAGAGSAEDGYRTAFFSLLLAFFFIEMRIQAGGRVKRSPVLYAHMATALPFLLSLSVLAFVAQPGWLSGLMAALGACAALTGAYVFAKPRESAS